MRQLVACPACCRQVDASALAPGERLACSCGAVVTDAPPQLRPPQRRILDVCDRHGIWFDHEELDARRLWAVGRFLLETLVR